MKGLAGFAMADLSLVVLEILKEAKVYRLFYYPRNASWVAHMVLAHLGTPYELVFVDRKNTAQKLPEYLKLNPTGRIPTLLDGDKVIIESAAISLYLCEQHPQGGLMPHAGQPHRAEFMQWLFYLTGTLQSELMIYFYPHKHTTGAKFSQGIVEAQEIRITKMFSLLDKQLAHNEYLVGDRLSVCDFYVFMLSHWADGFNQPPLGFSNLGGYLRRLAQHPTVTKVCVVENTSLQAYRD